jgi:hypothetical protein
MEQLLDVKIVPILFEFKVHHAKLEESSVFPTQQGIVDYRGLTPYTPRLHIDNREFRNKTQIRAAAPANQSGSENELLTAMDTTAKIAKEGNLLMNTQEYSDTLGILALQHAQPALATAIGIPSLTTNFDWDAQQLTSQYESDKQNYDWVAQNKPKLKFIPASVEFLVKEYAHVEFKYLGKPQYVPPSASPDYKPQFDITA